MAIGKGVSQKESIECEQQFGLEPETSSAGILRPMSFEKQNVHVARGQRCTLVPGCRRAGG